MSDVDFYTDHFSPNGQCHADALDKTVGFLGFDRGEFVKSIDPNLSIRSLVFWLSKAGLLDSVCIPFAAALWPVNIQILFGARTFFRKDHFVKRFAALEGASGCICVANSNCLYGNNEYWLHSVVLFKFQGSVLKLYDGLAAPRVRVVSRPEELFSKSDAMIAFRRGEET